ncbi:GNAT family N-acetyltransferase [Variovorax sp. RTB1]|uniref:GNAT family N-acetyltransferase n=1 Tax=Variovorax sp. RTB1 TaxID=3048631 RepID=UPI002B23C849|nr:GNAT family N-acetyltransferase [Variovorax sp. RTB1]MEB0112795.1 GNAT family N-acetyltransferase [Variovorax sp. RTB1]
MPTHATLITQWADSEAEVREAQRLRYLVFAQEMGARLTPPEGTPSGVDADRFDPYCDHLLVRAVGSDHAAGLLIGTYRVLTPMAAERAGGFYTDTEFDLAPLHALRSRAVRTRPLVCASGLAFWSRDHGLVDCAGTLHGQARTGHHDRLRQHWPR